ncbi:MAG: hypothetical protein RBT02_01355 [Bacteroidales bacterium]|jgi:hypothetical protein|nr:hypothetical protein [Bacteroidales bacterium]
MTFFNAYHKDRMVITSIIVILLLQPLAVYPQEFTDTISKQVLYHLDPVYGVDQRLVSGPVYNRTLPGSVLGNPYFIDEGWKAGSVKFKDLTFENLNLKYDIEVNRIVLLFTNANSSKMQIALDNKAIVSLIIDGRQLVPFPGHGVTDTIRFCEEIVGGELSYLVLRSKILGLQSGMGNRGYYYKEYMTQWLHNDSLLVPFRSKRYIYKLYPEHKQEMKQFMRSAKIYPYPWRMDDRAALIRFCNTLLTGN